MLVCMEGGRGLSVQKVCVFVSFLCFCVRLCVYERVCVRG